MLLFLTGETTSVIAHTNEASHDENIDRDHPHRGLGVLPPKVKDPAGGSDASSTTSFNVIGTDTGTRLHIEHWRLQTIARLSCFMDVPHIEKEGVTTFTVRDWALPCFDSYIATWSSFMTPLFSCFHV
jgi:hypothetical protein